MPARTTNAPAVRAAATLAIMITTAITILGLAGAASAHLSIIRQGKESRASMEAGDRFGGALAAGDFNGDGYDDLAMGAPGEGVGSAARAGVVIIDWGSAHGVTHVGAAIYTAAEIGGVVQAEEDVGFALAAGDFNNDGFDDLAIGAPGSNLGLGIADAGMIYIMGGSATGLYNVTQIDQADAGGSRETGDRFGASLAVGDFDADGYDDLGAGSPGEDGTAGAVFYLLGSTFGVPFGGAGWFKQSTLGGTDDPGDYFGWAIAAGNILGSSYDDLAATAPYDDTTLLTNIGRVWVIRGASTGLSASSPRTCTAGIIDNAQSSGNWGFGLAIGRFASALGYECLAIGEPGRDVGGVDRSGRVVIIEGGSGGLDSSSALAIDETDAGGILNTGDQFGTALCGGTFEVASDAYDDLAVGSPGESFGSIANAGNFYVFYGGASGPSGAYGWASFNQGTCNEPSEAGDEFGAALCFGRFDSTNKGTFAVGAPGEDNDAGMVHVIAPWRQLYGLSGKQSIAYDCENNLVFSAKPFDQVWIASTTKTMTCLIAAERSQLPANDPKYLDLDDEITIPAWVANNIPGSQVPLETDERINLRDLMYTCMMLSGNDAANAIAYFIYGGAPEICVTAFVAEMNARAAALGMNDTHFHNPAGLDNEPVGIDLGEHYSTPDDMAKLSRAAMNNTLLAQIVGTSTYWMTRHYYEGNAEWSNDAWSFNNFFFGILNSMAQPATGIKGGGTPNAKATGLFAAESDAGGTAIAGFYGVPLNDPVYSVDAANLLKLAVGQCNQSITINPNAAFVSWFGGLSSQLGITSGGAAQLGTANGRIPASTFDLYRRSGQGPTSAEISLRRVAELDFAPNETVPLGVGPFQRLDEIRIYNMGMTPVTFEVIKSWGGPAETVTIIPCIFETIPAYASPVLLPGATVTLRNITGAAAGLPAHVTIEEAYSFDLDESGAPVIPCFSVDILRQGPIVEDGFEVVMRGLDATNGSLFEAAVHDVGALTGVDDGGVAPAPDAAAAPLTLVSASPNPFASATRIAFDLARPARVGMRVYDVQGRLVREIAEAPFAFGRGVIDWDGRAADGARVAQGVYLYRLELDGRPAGGGKLVTLER